VKAEVVCKSLLEYHLVTVFYVKRLSAKVYQASQKTRINRML